MARKLGITREDVVGAAARLADEQGIEALNLAALASALGVRPPSLHHHIGGLRELRRALALEGAGQLRVRLRAAGEGLQGRAAPVEDLGRILAQLGIEGDDTVHVIRALRSYLHGFIDLERQRGFGLAQKLDVSFERGLALLIGSLGAA